MLKKIAFLTGTRADFGKIKSLIKVVQDSEEYKHMIFATGMHLNKKYGSTVDEIYKAGFTNIFQYINHDKAEHMDRTLAKTINGFSLYVEEFKPDLIIVHGDRVEALAGAIVGSLNNILVAHIEGGEISGTIDELIRHSVSKMSHIHLVANENARNRLIQLGELKESIFILGSPDLDLMNPKQLPNLTTVKEYYEIPFDSYAIAMFHPITTEYKNIKNVIKNFVDAIIESKKNYILIFPNNDLGTDEILDEYERLKGNNKIKIYPSLRFEFFLTLLQNADFIVGNSSAGVREAHYYNTPAIDIGSRQNNRMSHYSIFHSSYDKDHIQESINKAIIYNKDNNKIDNDYFFGKGNSNQLFLKLLNENTIWNIKHQKQFQDLGFNL